MTTSFAELGLNEQILAGVDALGFTEPTPVQAQAIPLVLQGRDIVASAQTGTGKTAAFTLPALQLIMAAVAENSDETIVQAQADASDNTGAQTMDAMEAPVSDTNTDLVSEDAPSAEAVQNTASDGQPRRRRRRHHRTTTAEMPAPDASVGPAPEEAPTTEASQDTTSEEQPRKRRRRRRRKTTAPESADVSAEAAPPTSADQPTEPAADETPAPKKRRRRRRKKSAAQTPEQPGTNHGPARPLALVVTPTRELAQQIERVTTTVCAHTGQRCVIVMGGARFDRQLKALAQGCDLLVATPGRLIDLMEHNHVNLSHVRILVLDEADRMLDMGFWPSVRRIVAALPSERQNLLFSATIPPSIKGTIDAMLTDPATVEIARVGETADTVEEHLCPVTQGQKTQLLQALIAAGGAEGSAALERVLVFCRTKHRVDDVAKTLQASGLSVEVMHADRPQKARDKALERFREGKVQLLIATDVMSRGIDVSGIDAVVNFDVPMDPEDYVHRIGRTGRAGATGHAYTFVAPDEITPLREIEYFTKKLIPTWDLPGFAYDEGRIVPNEARATSRASRTMFSGSKGRRGFGGPSSGRFGRHY